MIRSYRSILSKIRRTPIRLVFIFLVIILFSTLFIFYQKDHLYPPVLPLLENRLHTNNFSSLYDSIVLLSCSSDSYTSVYCYYLPYIALAWRRIGFEPVVLLVGSKDLFQQMALINLLRNDLKIKYYFLDVDSSLSISTSQIIRLFGGFLPYEDSNTKDLFILMGDVDLLPISRHRFEVDINDRNYILAVNAFCCPSAKFSYGNFHDISYYPISYVGMTKDLWKKIFLPLDKCHISSNITIDMIECCLEEKMNTKIPRNVIKGSEQWDIDQKFLSLLIAQAEKFLGTYVDKRQLGHRLDPHEEFLSLEFNSILLYDDIHLPNKNADSIFSDRTWHILSTAFSKLFQNETVELLSRYHYQTTASFLADNRTRQIPHEISIS